MDPDIQDVDQAQNFDIETIIKAWEKYNLKDQDLWESYQEDFEGWTEADFKAVSNWEIRRLRNVLRSRGVWVERSKLTVAKSLVNTLNEGEQTLWTAEEAFECRNKEEFTSRVVLDLIANAERVATSQPPSQSTSSKPPGTTTSKRPLGGTTFPPGLTSRTFPPGSQGPSGGTLPPGPTNGTFLPGPPEPTNQKFQPESPVAPLSPAAPLTLIAPLTPVAPVTPVALIAPIFVAPVAPLTSVAPSTLVAPLVPVTPLTLVTPFDLVAPLTLVAPLAPVSSLTLHVSQQASGQHQQPEQPVDPTPQQPLPLQQSQRKPIQYLQNPAQQPQAPHVPLYEPLLPIFEPPPLQFIEPANISSGGRKRLSPNLAKVYTRNVEIWKIKWIDGDSNPADSMTKAKPSQALQRLIDTNTIDMRETGWVERANIPVAW